MKKAVSNEKDVKLAKLAVIETGGKQYLIKPGNSMRVEKIIGAQENNAIVFDKVLLLYSDGNLQIGAPLLDTKIEGKFLKEERGKKIINLKYHSKTRYTRKKGHRQTYHKIAIGDF